jgi:hypothetical protein
MRIRKEKQRGFKKGKEGKYSKNLLFDPDEKNYLKIDLFMKNNFVEIRHDEVKYEIF